MSLSGTATVVIEWTMVFLALAFVISRGYVRFWQRQRLLLSDYFVFFAWLAFVSCCACDIRLNQLGLFTYNRTYEDPLTTINPDPALTVEALKLIYGSAIPYYGDLWLVMAALLAFYFELILRSHKPVWIALQVVTGFTVATFMMVLCLNQFYCQPISANWSLSVANRCINSPNLAVFIPSVISNIAVDLMSTSAFNNLNYPVFILPFFLLRNLHISRRQLYALISNFGLGGFAIIMYVARLIALAFSTTTTQVAVWTALECAVGIVVACCPPLRVLFRRAGDSELHPYLTRTAQGTRNRGDTSSGGVETSVNTNQVNALFLVHVGGGQISRELRPRLPVRINGPRVRRVNMM